MADQDITIKHGHARKVGVSPEYRSWCAMKNRCLNPSAVKWKNYGGRGIKVCERWLKFENFLEDMGPRPSLKYSINRIDNNGDYTPENCEWADAVTQANNASSTIMITANGKTASLCDWARDLGVTRTFLYKRKFAGWPDDKIINRWNNKKDCVLTVDGVTKRLYVWAQERGISVGTFCMRKHRGWSDERIVNTPLDISRKPKHQKPL